LLFILFFNWKLYVEVGPILNNYSDIDGNLVNGKKTVY